tara:strand:+ start:5167 stop:5394 length:228 start_codon:yes stop_codon:yes gene_type:complete
MNTQYFKVDGESHMIDNGRNHFVNGVCVNPLEGEGNIGGTHPPVESREPATTVTGHVPIVVTYDAKGKPVYTAQH